MFLMVFVSQFWMLKFNLPGRMQSAALLIVFFIRNRVKMSEGRFRSWIWQTDVKSQLFSRKRGAAMADSEEMKLSYRKGVVDLLVWVISHHIRKGGGGTKPNWLLIYAECFHSLWRWLLSFYYSSHFKSRATFSQFRSRPSKNVVDWNFTDTSKNSFILTNPFRKYIDYSICRLGCW